MHKQTKIFARRVEDFMHVPSVNVAMGTMCDDVIQLMGETKSQCCIVTDSHGKLAGILRMEDILSRVVFKVGPQTPIEDVMDRDVQTVRPEEYLYHAIGRMRRLRVREIVVVNQAVHPIGLVFLQDAIEIAAIHLMQQIDKLSAEGDINSLRGVKVEQVELAHDMFEDGQPAYAIQQLLSHVNNDLYGRIVHDTLCHMEAEGWGKPPVEFCVIVMGSGGREENYLYPDQDNGFILEDYPDEDHTQVDQFFSELSERMCRDLNQVGFPYCTGHVMASNPLWRKSLSQWVEQVQLWGRKRNSVALRLADIFFDYKPVWGQFSLADELRHSVLSTIKSNHFFLQEMHHFQSEHSVGLNMFGRIATEEDGEQKGKIDLKYRGTLPLVEAVRLVSLQHGLVATSTLERIELLHKAGVLSDTESDYLNSAFRFMTEILLKQQVSAFESGDSVTRYIDPKSLKQREQENLLRAFRHIEAFRKRVKGEFTGDVFS